ncbi:MAG: hypothetical protein ABIH11_00005, partial [Candidatus Altiarchaeota archaeon]
MAQQSDLTRQQPDSVRAAQAAAQSASQAGPIPVGLREDSPVAKAIESAVGTDTGFQRAMGAYFRYLAGMPALQGGFSRLEQDVMQDLDGGPLASGGMGRK